MIDFFAPQSPIFISHAWGDGSGVFVRHLKEAIEEQTLLNVWTDSLGINQVSAVVACAARLNAQAMSLFFYLRAECGRCCAEVQGGAVRCQRHHRVPDADVPHAAKLPARAALGA